MKIEDFDFELDPKRIAQRPAEPRDSSRLLACVARGRLGAFEGAFAFEDAAFTDLADAGRPWALGPGDLLVTNDAKVLPVRLLGARLLDGGGADGSSDSSWRLGGAVEALLLRRNARLEWSALMHMSAPARPGLRVFFEPGLIAEVVSTLEERTRTEGEVRLRFSGLGLGGADADDSDAAEARFERWLERHGHVPLPPYIERSDVAADRHDYQTVYARKTGSAAAPTAGFHFTDPLLAALETRGVVRASVTLHVGLGTFRPIKTEKVEDHVMHVERFEIDEAFLKALNEARAAGRRVVAVGTTVVRALESWAAQCQEKGLVAGAPESAGAYSTQAYIHPGYRFRVVDDLITNFHLPRSSLLVLVAAAMGLENEQAAYRRALQGGYRFFSYGDAMFVRGLGGAG